MFFNKTISIRTISQLIGQMVASFPGVERAKVYYRRLHNEKTKQLSLAKGNFDSVFQIPAECYTDLQWWIDNIATAKNPMWHKTPSLIIQSDASKMGWGGVRQGKYTGGSWSFAEQ